MADPPGTSPNSAPRSGTAPPATGPKRAGVPAHLAEVGKYRVVRLIGRGGMGAVYQATDPLLERDVALKVMLPQFVEIPEHKTRFEREARAAARMVHPNVVTVFDLGYHTDGSPYIVMELLRGLDLHRLLRERQDVDLRRKIAIVTQVLDGLGQAHRAGIVHRDIKPANVFIVESGDVKIMDFGIARISEDAAATAGAILGTANYMSPEQTQGLPLDGRSDIFSVGSMLAEMASGHSPFEADSPVNTLYRIVCEEPVLPLPAGPEGRLLEPILLRALAKEPEQRFASASEFAGALRELLAAPELRAGRAAGAAAPPAAEEGPTRRIVRPASSAARLRPDAPVPAPATDPAPLFRLLRDTYVAARSGHLHLASSHGRRLLRVLNGRIIDASSDVEGERLGDVLVRYGLLSQRQLASVVAVVLRERMKLGRVLAETGLLDQPRLEEAIGIHIREILFAMLDRADTSFQFEEMADSLVEADLTCRLSTAELILEATRRVQDPALVRRVIGDPTRLLALTEDRRLREQRITLTPVDGFVLSRIDGTLSAQDLLNLIPLPDGEVERSLFGLLCTGMIGTVEKRPATRPHARDRTRASEATGETAASRVAERPAPAPTPSRHGTASPGPGSRSPERRGGSVESARRTIQEMHGRLSRSTHYEVLGIERVASDAEVRQAYSRLVRVLHPDACNGQGFEDLQTQRAEVLVRVRQAFEVLRDLQARAAYDRRLELSALDETPPLPSPGLSTQAANRVAPSTGDVSPADVAPRAPVALAALAAAEAHLEAARYWDAIQAAEPVVPALTGSERTRARYVLARAYVKNPKWQHRAEQTLRLIVEEEPGHVEAHLLLAQIYADAGLAALSRGIYRRVLALDPQNVEARARLNDPDETPPATSRRS